MAEITTYDSEKGTVSKTEVDESAFGDRIKRRLLKDTLVMYEACRRQGTHSTLTRGEVSRTTRKPYRQKGTGYARSGDYRSPLRRGGGVIFGPKPRDYSKGMPRKAKREALRNALYAKLKDGEVFFVEGFTPEAPKTRAAGESLGKLGLEGSSLVVTRGVDVTAFKSFRNLARVDVLPHEELNAEHLLRHRNIVFLNDAFDGLKERLGNG